MDNVTSGCSATLYGAEGEDHQLCPGDIRRPERSDDLLWVDVTGDVSVDLRRQLEVPPGVWNATFDPGTSPRLGLDADFIWCQVAAVVHEGELAFGGRLLRIIVGPGFVLTQHTHPLHFLDTLHDREHGHTRLGTLRPPVFMASLLHWVLETYFDAVMTFEATLDRTEGDILDDRHDEDSVKLGRMRRAASRLRRMLGAHRFVFASIGRPDFLPDADPVTHASLAALERQFHHANDAVENARDLVIGTLEVLTNRIALRTNRSMRLLTFSAVLLGILSVLAGMMGMNFPARFFESGDTGFFATVAGMLVLGLGMLLIGFRRKWF